ncbi:hypothetical protein COE53_12505 [Bacillus sp. AFS029533]|nr:hypothetical protein COE53_12505 [Bacillus sp. AFS029533]
MHVIIYVSGISDKVLENYSSMRGVGIGKVDAIKQQLKLIKSMSSEDISPEEKTNQSRSIETLFPENVFLSFRKFCLQYQIKSIYEITREHIETYSNLKGIGIGKVEMVKQRINQIIDTDIDIDDSEENAFNGYSYKANLSSTYIEIDSLLVGRKFDRFKEYCNTKGLKTLGQLQGNHLEEFSKMPGIGKTRVSYILDILQDYSESNELEIEYFETGKIFDLIKDFSIKKLVLLLGYKVEINSTLKIKDIEGLKISELNDEIEQRLLIDLSIQLKKQFLPKELIDNFISELSERESVIFELRYKIEKTLEEVGTEIGVTRERVRQIAKKGLDKFEGYLNRNRFTTLISLLSNSEKYITRNELNKIIGSENEFFINLLKQDLPLLTYFRELDIFFLFNDNKVDFELINEFMNDLPEVFNFNEYKQYFEEMLESVGIDNPSLEMIENLISSRDFTKFGDIYSQHKLTIHEVLTYLLKNYISEPIRIDEEGIERLRFLAKRYLEFDLGESVRSIDARIRDAENLLLVDKSTFVYFNSEEFDTSIIDKIESYINNRFLVKEVINVEEIFQEFKPVLEQLKIDNKLHLYSLIRYYLDDKFSIGKGNTLNIYKNDSSRATKEERYISIMKKHGGLVLKELLLEDGQMYKVDLAIQHSNKIIPWGNKHVILVENLKITESEEIEIITHFNKSFEKGYNTSTFMFNEMMFDRKLSAFLKNKGINESNKLTSLIKHFMPNVKGHLNYLYVEGTEFESFENVIIESFNRETSRKEIKDFIFEHGYKEMMASNLLSRLLELEIYIEIDMDILYPARMFKIDTDVLDEIKSYAEEQIGSNEYLSISGLKGYRRKLPQIGFRWNPFLLKSVLHLCGFRQIKKFYSDYRYDKIIVVKKESKLETFEDLVLHVLNDYKGNMHEVSIVEYLVEKGILRENDSRKNLPHEIKTSDKFDFDELGYVKLR